MSKQRLTVQAVAELSGVTVRTLHHYDDIGLLRPTRGSTAMYREVASMYTADARFQKNLGMLRERRA